jgi:hypothetical protein
MLKKEKLIELEKEIKRIIDLMYFKISLPDKIIEKFRRQPYRQYIQDVIEINKVVIFSVLIILKYIVQILDCRVYS